jgi:hypothetical protein
MLSLLSLQSSNGLPIFYCTFMMYHLAVRVTTISIDD